MAFIVIVCSSCKWARGAKADAKRVKCQHCGATIDVRKAKSFATADNVHDLSEAVGRVNENLRRHKKVAPGPSGQPRPKFKGERDAVLELAKAKAEFTLVDVVEAIAKQRGMDQSAVDKEKVAEAIEDLLTKGFLMEFTYGRFRLV